MTDTYSAVDNVEPSGKPSYTRALKNRSLLLLWVGQLVSRSGDFIFDVAFILLVLRMTGSVFDVGLVTGFTVLPSVVVAPFAGVLIDRLNRRNVLVWSNAAQGLASGAIALAYASRFTSLPLFLVLVFLLNAGGQFTGTSVTTMIPRLVGKVDIAAANSLFSVSTSFNQLVFYGVGGVVVAIFGMVLPIYYDALTFVFAMLTVLAVPAAVGAIAPAAPGAGRASFLGSLVEGLGFIRRNAFLVELLTVAVVVNFFGGAVGALIAPYAVKVLDGPDSLYGFLLTALSAGSLAGGLVVGKFQMRNYMGALIFGGIAALGCLIYLMGVVGTAAVALPLLALLGAVQAPINISLGVLIQTKVPGEVLGRVVGALTALATLTVPIASVASGALATALSIPGTYQIFGAAILVTSGTCFLFFKSLREVRY